MMKRLFTFFLVVAMLFTLAVVFAACGNDKPAETTPAATTTTKPPKGVTVPKEPKGTEEDPFLINNADELKELVKKFKTKDYSGKIFRLTADIQLNDTSVDGWYDKEDAYVWPSLDGFASTLDGAGHTIDGLLIKGEMKAGGSSFGFVTNSKNAVLKNINFSHGYVKVPNDPENGGVSKADGAPSAGFLCGSGTSITVENCIAHVIFDCPKAYGVAPIGYINGNISISNTLLIPAYTVTPAGFGSLASGGGSLTVTNVLIAGKEKGVHWTGGFVTTNVYKLGDTWVGYEGTLTGVGEAASILGDAAKGKLTGFDFEKDWIAVSYDGAGYLPVPKVFADISQLYLPIELK